MGYDAERIFNVQLDRKLWRPLIELKARTGRKVKELVENAVKETYLAKKDDYDKNLPSK